MTSGALLRARWTVVRYGRTLALACLLVGALALGAAAWTHAHPQTATVTDQTHVQTVRSSVSTAATVAGNETLHEPGRTLVDRAVYLRSETPSATLTLTTTLPANPESRVTQRVVLDYRAERGGTTFWNRSVVLGRTTETTRSGTVRTRVPLDVAAIAARRAEVARTVGDAGTVHLDLRFVTTYATDRYEGTLTEPVPFRVEESWYGVGTPSASKTRVTPETRSVTVPRRTPSRTALLAGAAVLAGVLGIGAAGVRWVSLRRWDAADLAYELDRRRYAAWISSGRLPEDVGERRVAVESLEALVDVAIDTNGHVVYDPSRGRYAVFDGETTYHFDVWVGADGSVLSK